MHLPSTMNAARLFGLFSFVFVLNPLTLLSATAQAVPALKVTVTSNQDGIQSDDALTLREAIAIANGSLPLDRLSDQERSLVQSLSGDASKIVFDLPTGQTTIRLTAALPDLQVPGLAIDGTTQPGYAADQSTINELPMPVPLVAITPESGVEVSRGLTITGDRITIRGLSLYGFTVSHGATASTPPADIFIAHRQPPPDIRKQEPPANFSSFYRDDLPPKDVVIEQNWLGIPPSEQPTTVIATAPRSAFGVSVFNATNTTIRRNWIANHDSSAIITSVQAGGLQVSENVLIGNGVAGMPDAIRLEGDVKQAQITGNVICGNDGSGIYLFKPDGAVQIRDNQIIANGRRFRRAAVYLMGSDHQVTKNQIRYQAGPGVVVAADPPSTRNLVQTNQFANLEGLSIDLVTIQGSAGTVPQDYQRGDGANPHRDSPNRRKETGNGAIDAPLFTTNEFVVVGAETGSPSVELTGRAEPGTQIEVYRVGGKGDAYGPLTDPIATTETNAQGNFSLTLANLKAGDQVSAIATDPRYGTSEPARNARLIATDGASGPIPQAPTSMPQCVTPVAQQPPVPLPPAPIQLKVPRNIHFALDQATISPATALVIDRIAQVLLENPSILVSIYGHTDPRGSDGYNLALGARRAMAARSYLLRRGIAPERMTIRSFGERQPVSPGQTRLDFARDRRVEFNYKDARELEVIVQEDDLQIEPSGGRR